jgi:hypothetical protein
LRESRFNYFFGGSDAFTMFCGRDGFLGGNFTPLPSAIALMICVKLAFAENGFRADGEILFALRALIPLAVAALVNFVMAASPKLLLKFTLEKCPFA